MRRARTWSAVPVALALTATCLPFAAAQTGGRGFELEPAEPLERYRPVLRYDSREDYRAQPVTLPPSKPRAVEADRVYGHIAREGGETWLQYWFFYPYNPQDRGIVDTGRHEGDWEVAQFRVGPHGVPDLATLSGHTSAEGCDLNELETVAIDGVEAPVLYVANGSHAIYSRPGVHDRPFPDPNDEADGEGREVRPPLTHITDRRPGWVAYEGRWGASDGGWIPGEQPSPPGPRFQESDAWENPATFHAERAHDCGSDPPGRPWQAAVTVGVLAVFGLGIVAIVRRRRTRRRAPAP